MGLELAPQGGHADVQRACAVGLAPAKTEWTGLRVCGFSAAAREPGAAVLKFAAPGVGGSRAESNHGAAS